MMNETLVFLLAIKIGSDCILCMSNHLAPIDLKTFFFCVENFN